MNICLFFKYCIFNFEKKTWRQWEILPCSFISNPLLISETEGWDSRRILAVFKLGNPASHESDLLFSDIWEISAEFPNQYTPIYHPVPSTCALGPKCILDTEEKKTQWRNTCKVGLILGVRSYDDQRKQTLHGGAVRSFAKERKCNLDFWTRLQEEKQQEKYLFVPLNHKVADHAENKSQRYDCCKICCITKRLPSDWIQLYSGNLTGPGPAEITIYRIAKRQRSIYCFEFPLGRCLLTECELAQDPGRKGRGCGWGGPWEMRTEWEGGWEALEPQGNETSTQEKRAPGYSDTSDQILLSFILFLAH